MGVSTDAASLDVVLPSKIGCPSTANFLPEEEVSINTLLFNTNGSTTLLSFVHPLSLTTDNDINCSGNEDNKADTSSSIGSSSGLGNDMTVPAASTLFAKNAYQHLKKNNGLTQDLNSYGPNSNLNLSKDTPSFVSWNWPLIRKFGYFIFMSSLLAMSAMVVVMIITLPKTCNPRSDWYKGTVFYEIFPASFQDSNNDGIGDIRGILNSVEYFESIGISAIRLNSIFSSKHYPDDFVNVTSLTEMAEVLGSVDDLRNLSEALHKRNISLILDLPLFPFLNRIVFTSGFKSSHLTDKQAKHFFGSPLFSDKMVVNNLVSNIIRNWINFGIDGFYIKGLKHYVDDYDLIDNLSEWKFVMGPNKILIISENFLSSLDQTRKMSTLDVVDLVDVHLDIFNGTKNMKTRIKDVISGVLRPRSKGAWIQWSISGVEYPGVTQKVKNSNITLAAMIIQLMLPGTPNIFYGDEIALGSTYDPQNEHSLSKTTLNFTIRETPPWLTQNTSFTYENLESIVEIINLRDRSPSIYKNAICKSKTILSNTQIRSSHDDIIIVERVYPRRNTFVSISNFGKKHVTMDITSMYYSGQIMLGKTVGKKIYFSKFEIGALETVVVKLDK